MNAFITIALLSAFLFAYGCVSQSGSGNPPPSFVGNASDTHGCKSSAGYVWCDSLQKCLRIVGDRCTNATIPRACTEEAKLCPDGSSVGRAGPNCEFAPCPEQNFTLYGKITIGPLCPVEPCGRVFDYGAVRVNVYDSESNNLVARARPDSGGNYGFRLAQGSYLVNVTDASGTPFGMPGLDYTQSISLGKGQKIEMDFDIDTGIR